MAESVVDLFVSGVQKIVAEHARNREPESAKIKRSISRVNEEFIRKSKPNKTNLRKKRLSEPIWETESSSSSVSNPVAEVPVIWVDIVKKLTVPETKEITKPIVQKTSSIWKGKKAAQQIIPDSFQSFLQRNLNLIAEVQIAKLRRSNNRQIFRPQEDNINWTSNAPRPSDWLLNPPRTKRGKNRVKKNNFELPCGLQGVHLKGREPRKTNARQCRHPKRLVKRTKSHDSSEDLQDQLNWMYGNVVTFQLPKPGKPKRRRRRCAKKKTKVFSKSISLFSIYSHCTE